MRLGVLDIGSNTVHLLLVDAHPGARPVPFASHKRPLQLVAHLDDSGAITAEGQRLRVEFGKPSTVRPCWITWNSKPASHSGN